MATVSAASPPPRPVTRERDAVSMASPGEPSRGGDRYGRMTWNVEPISMKHVVEYTLGIKKEEQPKHSLSRFHLRAFFNL